MAHIIAHKCKETKNYRFVKLSATMCGINDVKDVINKAKGDASFRRKTVIFMDEIHRFNKLQQVNYFDFNYSISFIFNSSKTFGLGCVSPTR